MPTSSRKYFSISEGLFSLLAAYIAEVPGQGHLARLGVSVVVADLDINQIAAVLQKKQFVIEPLQLLVQLVLLKELMDDA